MSKLKSISPAVIVEPLRRSFLAAFTVSCGTLSVSTSKRPMSVLLPSSTLPHVSNRIIGDCIRSIPLASSSPLNLH